MKWLSVSCVLLVSLLFINGCLQGKQFRVESVREYKRVIEVSPVFTPCLPDRGEGQDDITQSRGLAFNSAKTGCI